MPTAVRRGVARAQPTAEMAKSPIRCSPGLGFGFRWRTEMERVVAKLDGEEREKIAAAEAVIAVARQGAAMREQGMAARPRGTRDQRRARRRRDEDGGRRSSPSPPRSLRGEEPRRAQPGPCSSSPPSGREKAWGGMGRRRRGWGPARPPPQGPPAPLHRWPPVLGRTQPWRGPPGTRALAGAQRRGSGGARALHHRRALHRPPLLRRLLTAPHYVAPLPLRWLPPPWPPAAPCRPLIVPPTRRRRVGRPPNCERIQPASRSMKGRRGRASGASVAANGHVGSDVAVHVGSRAGQRTFWTSSDTIE